MIEFSENTRVKIPALVHATRLGYKYLSLKENKNQIDPRMNIFKTIFRDSINTINNINLNDSELEKLLDEIDDERILFILNSNKKIDNDSEFAYYYALPDIRIFNNYIRRTSKYDTFLFVDKNTRFLEFSIYTVARQKLFTYSYSYSLNKNLNKLHTVLNNFRNQLNKEVIEAERIEKENIEFIKTTAEKLKRSKLLKCKNLQVNVVQKNKYVNVFFTYGKIQIKYTGICCTFSC
jgi:hypothetical protein